MSSTYHYSPSDRLADDGEGRTFIIDIDGDDVGGPFASEDAAYDAMADAAELYDFDGGER